MSEIPFYDLQDPSYNFFWYYEVLCNRQLGLIQHNINSDIKSCLNIGAGHAIYEKHIIPMGVKCSIIDAFQCNIEFIKDHYPEIDAKHMDIETHQLPGNYDMVICLDVMKWICNWRFVLDNIAAIKAKKTILSVHCLPVVKTYRHYIQHIDNLWGKDYNLDKSYNGIMTVFSEDFISSEIAKRFNITEKMPLRNSYNIKPQHMGQQIFNPWVGDTEIIFILSPL